MPAGVLFAAALKMIAKAKARFEWVAAANTMQ